MRGQGAYSTGRMKLSSAKIRIFTIRSMKKLVVLIIFFLIAGTNGTVVSFAMNDDRSAVQMPLEEETKDVLEEDDDEDCLEHYWHSREISSNSNLHFVYQEILFHDLEFKVVIPPPKA